MSERSIQVLVHRITDSIEKRVGDMVAVEEPLEMRITFGPENAQVCKSVSITMRTPGHDLELALGFLFTEGILKAASAVNTCRSEQNQLGHILDIELKPDVSPALEHLDRNFFTSSSCGVCGKGKLENVKVKNTASWQQSTWAVSSELICALPDRLRQNQSLFDQTGGLHACAIFDKSGQLQLLREDVGRHNALDKLVGDLFLHGKLPCQDSILLLSGRISFELVQKAAMAGIQIMAAVGAPSSLAIKTAEEAGITLIGFLRGNRFNIYCGAHRVVNTIEEPIHVS